MRVRGFEGQRFPEFVTWAVTSWGRETRAPLRKDNQRGEGIPEANGPKGKDGALFHVEEPEEDNA